ncbi:MAG: transposase [Psychroflexus sp.]
MVQIDCIKDIAKHGLENSRIATFYRRIVKYKNYLFNHLKYPNVPPDNNGSERAIRNIKALH